METIIFDLGGVVLNRGIWIWREEYFTKNFNVSNKDVIRVMIESHYKDYFSGKITEEEYWTRCLSDLNIRADWKKLRSKLIESFDIQAEVIEAIQNLKQQGHRIGLLSDQSKEWWLELDKKYNISQNFDFVIISALEGISKPNSEIYKLMLSKTNNKPQECIYIDDLEHNLSPAKQLGMQTIFFQNPKQLNKKLLELLK